MICASEVLPSPGGPASSTWSSDSSRRRAASMKTASWRGDLRLVDELGEPARAQRAVELVVAARASLGDRPSAGDRAVEPAVSASAG